MMRAESVVNCRTWWFVMRMLNLKRTARPEKERADMAVASRFPDG